MRNKIHVSITVTMLVLTMVIVVANEIAESVLGAVQDPALQRASEQVATASGPVPEVFLIAAGVLFVSLFGPQIVSAVGPKLFVALETLIGATVPSLFDRLRLGDAGIGWQRRVDTFRYPGQEEGGGLREDLVSFAEFESVDEAECAHCGADLNVDLGSTDAEDVILRRARRDWMAGPFVARRESVTNLYCGEACEAGRLDPLLDTEEESGYARILDEPLTSHSESD